MPCKYCFWKLGKKVYSREVLERVGRVTVNTAIVFSPKGYYFTLVVADGTCKSHRRNKIRFSTAFWWLFCVLEVEVYLYFYFLFLTAMRLIKMILRKLILCDI